MQRYEKFFAFQILGEKFLSFSLRLFQCFRLPVEAGCKGTVRIFELAKILRNFLFVFLLPSSVRFGSAKVPGKTGDARLEVKFCGLEKRGSSRNCRGRISNQGVRDSGEGDIFLGLRVGLEELGEVGTVLAGAAGLVLVEKLA